MTVNDRSALFGTGGYVPVVPGPLDTAAIWGASREHQTPDGARPHLSPGRPPWEPEGKDRSGWVLRIVLILLGLILMVLSGVTLQRQDVLPVGVPLIGKDTGVAACEAIAGGDKLTTLNSGDGRARGSKMSEADYLAIRGIFADSRYAEIRTNGTRMADYAWQITNLGEEAGLAALPMLMPMMQSYSGLAGACADHGYTIPALGS